MIVSMKLHSTKAEIDEVCRRIEEFHYRIHAIEGVDREVGELLPGSGSGVVHDDVDPAEHVDRTIDDLLAGVRGGQVEFDRFTAPSAGDHVGRDRRQRAGFDVDGHDVGAVAGETRHRGRSDAAAGAGHDRHLARECSHHRDRT